MPYFIALILALIFIFQLFVILFSYGKFEDLHKEINGIALNLIVKLQKTSFVQKYLKFKEELYIFAVNFFVASTIFTLINIEKSTVFILCIYLISIILYLLAFIIKFQPENETFEEDYQIEFIIATTVGLIFAFGENLYAYWTGSKEFNPLFLIFLVGFVYFYFAERKKHNKFVERNKKP
jgi:NADH:ubiquinone oxidoreductase subunit 6 (subunit J)